MQSQAILRSAVDLIFPHQCAACRALVQGDGVLCGACWRETPFIVGLVCDACGTPLPGEADESAYCDACLGQPPGWSRGRAALVYRDVARRLVLALKHGDRLELVRPAAAWIARAGAPLLTPEVLVVPVPVHRWRLLRRRYNQAALLAAEVARHAGARHMPDLLRRDRATQTQDGKSRDERFANLAGAISVSPRRRHEVEGRRIVLVDDVMTSGATLSGCAEALSEAGAAEVSVLVLARVARDA